MAPFLRRILAPLDFARKGPLTRMRPYVALQVASIGSRKHAAFDLAVERLGMTLDLHMRCWWLCVVSVGIPIVLAPPTLCVAHGMYVVLRDLRPPFRGHGPTSLPAMNTGTATGVRVVLGERFGVCGCVINTAWTLKVNFVVHPSPTHTPPCPPGLGTLSGCPCCDVRPLPLDIQCASQCVSTRRGWARTVVPSTSTRGPRPPNCC